MSLFKRDKKELPPLWSDNELAEMAVNYNSVLDWLLGLSDQDYETVCKVAAIHRQANKDAAKALGLPDEPTSFIHSPADDLQTLEPITIDKSDKTMLDDDDISSAFLEDEPEPLINDKPKAPNKIKTRKVKVNN